jgi:hypothetical protein
MDNETKKELSAVDVLQQGHSRSKSVEATTTKASSRTIRLICTSTTDPPLLQAPRSTLSLGVSECLSGGRRPNVAK